MHPTVNPLGRSTFGGIGTATSFALALEICRRDPSPKTDSDWLERAREIVRRTGDLPEGIYLEIVLDARDQLAVALALKAMRPKDAPPYQGGWI